jgi:flagellin-like hook-associated protein FlgL
MSVSPIGSQSSLLVQQLVNMRSQLDDLQTQLGTGQKSQTYAGLGLGRGVSVGLNAQLSAISGFDNNITMASTRIDLMNTALSSMGNVSSTVKQAMNEAASSGDSSGALNAQATAQGSLSELVDLLNTQSGSRYLFSGRATDTPAVATADQILNGDTTHAGLTQLISERNQADLGSNGLGRLNLAQPTSTSVSVTEDAGVFGLKLASATSTSSAMNVTGPTGSPASLSVDFSAQPNAGDSVKLTFNLPDGTSTDLTLSATTDSPPKPGQFTIGATPADTAANFQSALSTGITTVGKTSLTAASAVAASNDFFNGDASNPPQRVNGPPFDTATGMTAGTSANTVIWYTGETGTDSARQTANVQIDPSLSVSYGARANESAFRTLVQNVATLAAVNISQNDPNAAVLSQSLNQRLTANLASDGDQLTVVGTQLAGAQSAMSAAQTRHQQTSTTLQNYQQQISGVSSEQVGAEMLSLQTRMQASMQTTATLFKMSLVNYI